VTRNSQPALFDLGDDDGVSSGPVYRRLVENGVSERLARQWLSEHPEKGLVEKLDWIDAERKQGRVRKTPAAYLTAAIKGDYQLRPVKEVASKPRRAVPVRDAAEDRRHMVATVQRAWRHKCISSIDSLCLRHSTSRRKVDKDRFEALLVDEIDKEQFRRYGWGASLLFKRIHDYWSDLAADAIPAIEDVAKEHGISDWTVFESENSE